MDTCAHDCSLVVFRLDRDAKSTGALSQRRDSPCPVANGKRSKALAADGCDALDTVCIFEVRLRWRFLSLAPSAVVRVPATIFYYFLPHPGMSKKRWAARGLKCSGRVPLTTYRTSLWSVAWTETLAFALTSVPVCEADRNPTPCGFLFLTQAKRPPANC